MKRLFSIVAGLMLLCGVALFSVVPVSAEPIDAGAEAGEPWAIETQHDLYRVRLAFHRRHLAGAYREAVETPSPHTTALFGLLAETMSARSIPPEYLPVPDPRPTVADYEAAVERVLAEPEPGVWDHFALARAYAVLKQFDNRVKHATAAIPLLDPAREPGLHANFRVYLYWHIGRTGRETPPAEYAGKLDGFLNAAVVEATEGPFAHPAERRVIFWELWEDYLHDDAFKARDPHIRRIAEHPEADPWIAAALVGVHEIETAWEKRGSGFAHRVDEAGWKGFEEHLALARTALRRAIEIDPRHPEPYAELITVAMGGEARGPESPGYWFEQATAAQYDWWPAYTKLLWASRPRWGGSHEAMRAIADRALAEARYDTRVPFIAIKAYNDIQSERADDEPMIWAEPEVKRKLDIYYRRFVERFADNPPMLAVNLSQWAVMAYLAGDHAQARELVARTEGVANGFVDDAWIWRHVQFGAPFMMDDLLARGGPAGGALAAVEAETQAIGPDDAARRFTAFAAELNPGLPAQTVAHRKAFAARVEHARTLDRPLNLLGPHPPAVFREVGSAEWSRQFDGSIKGVGTRTTTIRERERYLHTPKLFGRDLRIKARVRLEPLRGDREPNVSVLFGMYEKSNGSDLYHTVQFIHDPDEPHRHRVEIGWRYHWHRETFNRPIPLEFEFEVEYLDQHVTVWIDGERVGRTERPLRFAQNGSSPRAVGLGFRVYEPQQTVHFEVLEVTEID